MAAEPSPSRLIILGQGEGRVHDLVVRQQEGMGRGGLLSGLEGLLELGGVGVLEALVLGPLLLGHLGLQRPLLARRSKLRPPYLRNVGIELEHGAEVAEGVALLRGLGEALLGRPQLGVRLHFVGVDDARQVRVGHQSAGEGEVLLDVRLLAEGAEDAVELLEGGLRPDDKAAKVATRRELEQVEAVHAGNLDTGDVAERLLNAVVTTVHNEGALALNIAAIPHLALAAADLLRILGVIYILNGLD
mmetsp:Transcript_47763/g.126687  ORF Transcript_47763/g.126687 Transcript_47763/m.126687 type:complete len:246 (-) Transcript_47763:526-1263(-)